MFATTQLLMVKFPNNLLDLIGHRYAPLSSTNEELSWSVCKEANSKRQNALRASHLHILAESSQTTQAK